MGIYKYRHIIAKFTLTHLLFIMFLSVHFTAWGGYYTEDGLSLACIVSQEMHTIKEETSQLNLSPVHLEPPVMNLWMAVSCAIGLLCPLFFVYFFGQNNDKMTFVRNTLVRLSVRLDN